MWHTWLIPEHAVSEELPAALICVIRKSSQKGLSQTSIVQIIFFFFLYLLQVVHYYSDLI